jgi:hypothetical protein
LIKGRILMSDNPTAHTGTNDVFLAEQLKELAARFRRIDTDDEDDAWLQIDAACEWGIKLILQHSIIPSELRQEVYSSDGGDFGLAGMYIGILDTVSALFSDVFPGGAIWDGDGRLKTETPWKVAAENLATGTTYLAHAFTLDPTTFKQPPSEMIESARAFIDSAQKNMFDFVLVEATKNFPSEATSDPDQPLDADDGQDGDKIPKADAGAGGDIRELARYAKLLRRAIENIPEPNPTKPRLDDPIPGYEERRRRPNASPYFLHEIRPHAIAFARCFRANWPNEYRAWVQEVPDDDPNCGALGLLNAILAQEEATDSTPDRLPQNPTARTAYRLLVESEAATVNQVAELLTAAVDDILERFEGQPEDDETTDEGDSGPTYFDLCLTAEPWYQHEGTEQERHFADPVKRYGKRWRRIRELSCRLFGHPAFSRATWQRLNDWLLERPKLEWNEILSQSLDTVIEWLREAEQQTPQAGTAGKIPEADAGAGLVLTLDGPRIDAGRVAYGVDYRSVSWYGTPYGFTATQAACVKVLFEHYKHGVFDVGEQTILTAVDSSQTRLASVFDNGKHPAWKTMIQPGSTKGTVRLAEPG